MLGNFDETIAECICILICYVVFQQLPILHDLRKQLWTLDHQNQLWSSTSHHSLWKHKPNHRTWPNQEPMQVFLPFLLILFTLTGLPFADLSIQNRHFLSSLSVRFASIGICVVSMFWVISSSVHTWPTNTLTSRLSEKFLLQNNSVRLPEHHFFLGLNWGEPHNDGSADQTTHLFQSTQKWNPPWPTARERYIGPRDT